MSFPQLTLSSWLGVSCSRLFKFSHRLCVRACWYLHRSARSADTHIILPKSKWRARWDLTANNSGKLRRDVVIHPTPVCADNQQFELRDVLRERDTRMKKILRVLHATLRSLILQSISHVLFSPFLPEQVYSIWIYFDEILITSFQIFKMFFYYKCKSKL